MEQERVAGKLLPIAACAVPECAVKAPSASLLWYLSISFPLLLYSKPLPYFFWDVVPNSWCFADG